MPPSAPKPPALVSTTKPIPHIQFHSEKFYDDLTGRPIAVGEPDGIPRPPGHAWLVDPHYLFAEGCLPLRLVEMQTALPLLGFTSPPAPELPEKRLAAAF